VPEIARRMSGVRPGREEYGMLRKSLIVVVVLGLGAFGCKKDEAKSGGGGGGGGGGGPTLAGFKAGADYQALMTVVADGTKLVADGKCADALPKAKEALALVLKLVPGYGAIGEAAKSDKALSDLMSALNAARGTLELGIPGLEENLGQESEKIYCDGVKDSLASIAAAQ